MTSKKKDFLSIIITIVVLFSGYKWYQQSFIYNSNIAEGLSIGTSVKNYVAEYYLSNGEFPISNEDIGIPPPENFTGQSLIALEILEGGIISLKYNKKSGIKEGIIQLIPDVGLERIGIIQWQCISPSYKNISDTFLDCQYLP